MAAKDDCYKLVQQIVKARDVFCQRPGCNREVDVAHHLFKRDRMATAFLPEAAIGFCVQDHGGLMQSRKSVRSSW